jgi:demethylmenaquinone methyltransferase / 2-methoxy-6-polyprenyl-1,4-benzoquinol methylase
MYCSPNDGSANEWVARDADKARYVRAMFTRIARRYDLMNTLMTGGRHHAWRRLAAQAALATPDGAILDLATGTGDLALAIAGAAPYRRIVAADFSEGMLREAGGKLAARPEAHVSLLAADALALPFGRASFACVVSAFLLRNLADLGQGLEEMRRVVRPGGRVITLDIVEPTTPGFAYAFAVYFHRVVPLVGALVAGDRAAYTYLPDSVARFVSPDELCRIMERAGLKRPTYRRLGLGTIAIHTAVV